MKETAANAGKNESASLQKYTASVSQAKLQPEAEIDPQNGLMLQRMCRGCRSSQEDLQADLAIMPFPVRRSAAMSLQKSLGNRFMQGLAVQAKLVAGPEEKELRQGRLGAGGVAAETVQAKPEPNRTGMPDQLKTGIEALSGMDMSDVRVHANSDKPEQLNALAYTLGNQIHLGPGQGRHLPHEAWHVVQQKQGRVQPTTQLKDGVPVNDDEGLEREADVMGARALARVAQLQGTAHVRRKARKYHAPAFAPHTAVRLRTVGQGAPALLQTFVPKGKKQIELKNKLRREYVALHDDDEEYYGPKFDGLVKAAETMQEIEGIVGKLREEMKAKAPPMAKPKLVAPAPEKQTGPLPTSEVMSALISSAPSSTPVKSAPGKKEKKYKPMPPEFFSAGQTPAPAPNAWKKPLGSVPNTVSKAMQPAPEVVDEETANVKIQFIKDVIEQKQNVTVRSFEVDGEQALETVYYKIIVAGPVQPADVGRLRPFQYIYTLYLHYHPRPISANWLHIKRAHGGDPENIVSKDNWLFDKHKAILTEGRQRWENTYGLKATPGHEL